MTSKHTSGPWDYRVAANGDCGITAKGTGVFAEAFADIRHAHENNKEEALANAKLISKAPDLLAFAQSYDTYISKHFQDGPESGALHSDAAAIWKTCRSVISEATGAT